MEQLSLTIEGMTCFHCAKRVQVALRRVPAVSKAHVNLASKTATVDYDPEETTVGALMDAIKAEGFQPGVSKARLAVQGLRCASCVAQVEDALAATAGVISAVVNPATAEVDIEYRPSLINVEGLSHAVEAGGYLLAPAMVASEEGIDRHAHQQFAEYRGLMRCASSGLRLLYLSP